MNVKIQRFIAVMLLVIPGFIATYGFLLMKNVWFTYFALQEILWWKGILGLLMFVLGIAFIGGWIFFRDRKRNYVAPRFRKKRPRPQRPSSQTAQSEENQDSQP
jgi:type II secretory pathway component PulF